MSRKKLFEMEPGGTVLYLYALREISRENRNLWHACGSRKGGFGFGIMICLWR